MSVIKFLVLLGIYGLIRVGDFVGAGVAYTLNAIKIVILTSFSVLKTSTSKTLQLIQQALQSTVKLVLIPRSVTVPSFQPRRKKKQIKKRKITHYAHWKIRVKYFFLGSIVSFVFLFLPIASLLFLSDLPSPHTLSFEAIPKTTKIYDRNGELLYEIFANQNRTLVELSDIPQELKDATIAIEDSSFYSHPGFDIRGISRALLTNLRTDELQGGSTITQQLIKSALLTPEPTIERKIKEVVIAFWAERIYTKDEILEMYFNYIPYGGTAWGIEAASQVYFGKDVSELNLAESAYLAGLPKAPSVYSPFGNNPELGKQRQRDVLNAMVKNGFITQAEADAALVTELAFEDPEIPLKAPHFVMYVKEKLVERYGLSRVERGGLSVVTTVDMNLQRMAEQIVKEEVEKNASLNIGNGAALITDPETGDILAMVGSKDFFDSENDGNVNLTTSLRQPGSTIKLVTYSLALSSGFTEATVIEDAPLSIRLSDGRIYSPVNYGGKYHGRQPLRNVFANSFNTTAVRVAQQLGVENIISFGKQMGITSWGDPGRYGLSITLGGGETTMIDLATIYGTVANGGARVYLDPILRVEDSNGELVYEKNPIGEEVVSPEVSFIISDILSDNEARSQEFGLNSPLNIPGHRVSVKTGTTDNKRDNWTIGYTTDFVVATWVGNNDNSPMSENLTSGITGAAPMWNSITNKMIEEYPADGPVRIPPGIIQKYCLGERRYFIRGTENSVRCSVPRTAPTPAVN